MFNKAIKLKQYTLHNTYYIIHSVVNFNTWRKKSDKQVNKNQALCLN